MSTEEKSMSLQTMVRKIQRKEILLPDFQRGFVWQDEEKQIRLAASVLAQMHIGSILLLEASPDTYSCKMIGRNTKLSPQELPDGKVCVLLDGQQRITVLTNIFSNAIFSGLDDYGKLASPCLKKQFFIRIPFDDREDIFGLNRLKFDMYQEIGDEWVPRYCTENYRSYLCTASFSRNNRDKEPFHPDNKNKSQLFYYCLERDAWYIPLYLLLENYGGDKCRNRMKELLVEMAGRVCRRFMESLEGLGDQERMRRLRKMLDAEYWEELDVSGKTAWDGAAPLLERQGAIWADAMMDYLNCCAGRLKLHEIRVPEAERERAIDIYENLNLGGITLSTFDLVLARAAKGCDVNKGSLLERILQYISLPQETYRPALAGEEMESRIEQYLRAHPDFSASAYLGCCKKKSELNRKYTDAFLDILSMLVHNPRYEASKVSLEQIKRNTILNLSPEEINGSYQKACAGLDRACFFLIARCGIRSIAEVHYNLMLVVAGFLLSNDAYYQKKEVHKTLEAWYWSSIFSESYEARQNETAVKDLAELLDLCEKPQDKQKPVILAERCDNVLRLPELKKEYVLMESERVPGTVWSDSICQFYLARSYRNMLDHKLLHTLCEEAAQLEKHHIIPLGNLDITYKEGEQAKKKRKDSGYILNSPFNYAYITKQSNQKIASRSIREYFRQCSDGTLAALGISLNRELNDGILDEEKAKELLEERLRNFTAAFERRMETCLNGRHK